MRLGSTHLHGEIVIPRRLAAAPVRGGGLGRLLSVFVSNRIMARGEVPYLHAYANNANAIRLYESIGFRLRSKMNVAVVQRAG